MFARFSTLLLAAVLASPALWKAFVLHDMDIYTALIRYLIAVLVAAAMLAAFRMIVQAYHEIQERHRRQELEARRMELIRRAADDLDGLRPDEGTTRR